jgi:hypothetical protein
VDILRRHDILDATDAARLHEAGRDPGCPDGRTMVRRRRRWRPAADTSLADVLG